MRKNKDFLFYTAMWIVAVLFLAILLWQNVGDARIINYSGIVRGATQKLVKEELNGQPDDTLINRLDGIIYDLQTGEGEYGLTKSKNQVYQQQLTSLKSIWEEMKSEVALFRSAQADGSRLYTLSQQHFEYSDRLVQYAEENSNTKLQRFTLFYFLTLFLSLFLFILLNIRSRKALEKGIATDSLTGILNRKGFESAADKLLRQHGTSVFTILKFDVNNFKYINNTYGYRFGDDILRSMAAALAKKYNNGQLCARIDADDFLLLLYHTGDVEAELVRTLNGVLQERLRLETLESINFTAGAYQIERNNEPIKNIIDKVGIAHKTAKAEKNTAMVWYNAELVKKLQMEEHLENQMHRSLTEERFQMYLQPKLDLRTLQTVGAEALVRWDLPGYGLVYPDSFIPLFEKNGFIAELDFYMLRKACAYLRNRLDQNLPVPTISVNFSRVSLYHPTFYETFMETVEQYRLPYSCIEIEVTESAFNDVSDTVIQLLFRLKERGFVISMDDFGAGFSSLNMLNKLPIQVIKLDKGFLNEMQQNENVKGVISCAVNLAHVLGMQVVCEGVEQPEQVTFLQSLGCDYGQGFYFSKPIPQSDFLMEPSPDVSLPE